MKIKEELDQYTEFQNKVDPYVLINQIMEWAKRGGVYTGTISMDGVKYGELKVVFKDDVEGFEFTQNLQVPTSFKSLRFEDVRFGENGNAIGDIEFRNLDVKVELSVTIK